MHLIPLIASAVLASFSGPSDCALPAFGPGAQYHPQISSADFSPNIDNPWFPMTPGKTYVYAGNKDGKPSLDLVVPSTRTKAIDGVTTRVVEDRLYLSNRLAERTSDYYAQDRCGNVWYFGEDTADLNRHGRVTTREGTWHSGQNGALPGVIMQAQPEVGRRFRQEWLKGHAEDVFKAVDISARAKVPFGRFSNVLRTEETTALEPGVLDNKFYAKGIGELSERTVKGGHEAQSLVEILG
jgi:hypothetical protein